MKWAIPFAVLTLTCGIAAGCGGGHEHGYTEWGYNETQHWKECPEDHEKDEGTVKNHNFVDGSCECGATQQTPPVTDVTITNGTTDANGTVTLSKTTAKTGDSVTVTVAPKEGYQLKSLTVNGVNVAGAMTGNAYEFKVSENTTVIAVFEKIASSSVNAAITGKRYGVTGNSLKAGTAVTLSANGREDVDTEIKAEGDKLVIKVAEIAGDNWSVKVDGYVAATIIVPRDVEYTSAITLEYDLMENLCVSWGDHDAVDLSKQNDGEITHTSGYYQWVSTKDSYESVAITAKVVKGGFRQGVFIRFKGDNYADDGYVMLQKENQQKLCICGAGDGFTGKNLWANQWDEYLNPLAKDEYDLTLVRDGVNILIFIDGEYKATKVLPEEYADKECYVGLFCTDATFMEGARTFSIQDTVSVTDETTDTNGTVTIDKTTAKVNEEVTVTLTADQGYKIKDLTVNGQSVLNDLHAGVYKFNALKDTVIVAEFEENKTVDGVEVTVNAAAGFVAEGATLTFEQLDKTWTGTVSGNKVTLGSASNPVALGTHNVYADFGGYQISLGTVTVEAPESGTTATAEVTLGFTGAGIEYAGSVSSANPATGELTYKLGNDDNGAYNNKYDIKTIENGGYFATKIKFTQDGSLSVILRRTGDNKEFKYVVQNNNSQGKGDGNNFVFGFDDDGLSNGIWTNGAFVSLASYNNAFKGDGVWIVLGYDAQTGGLTSYIGTSLNAMRPLKTLKSVSAGIAINGMGVGNWFGPGSNSTNATVTMKYGETMADIGMSLSEQVDVTCSVTDDTMGDIKLDAAKYYPGAECTVTVTANAGYFLKSIKVGGGEAVDTGWSQNGLVYTYKFTVPEGGAAVVATLEASPEVELTGAVVEITDGIDVIDLGETVIATLTLLGDEPQDVTLTKATDGTYTFGGTFIAGDYSLTLKGKYVGYPSVSFTIEDENLDKITVTYALTGVTDKGPRDDASISVTKDTITIVGTQADAFAEFSGGDHNDNGVPYVTLNISDEVKNAKNLMLEFNLKTSNQCGYFMNGFGVGLTGFNGLRMLFADTADKAYTPDGKIVTAILNGRKMSENDFSGSGHCVETYGWIETLALTSDGVNMRAVRNGTTLKFYAQNADGEWVLIKFLAPVNGNYGNLRYVDSVTVSESDLNDIRFIANGANWDVTDISVTLNPENIDNASYCTSNITFVGVEDGTDLTGTEITLTDRDDETKTYTVELKKNDGGYYIEGYFRAGNYNITVDGYTCTSAGKDESNQPTTALWIDNVGGECWGITLTANAEVTE